MTRILALLIGCLLTACITGHLITESTHSIPEIRSAIYYIAGTPRSVSENGREFVSAYFSRKKDPHFDANKASERLYAKFTILGDRRPYDIQVQVFIEERSEGVYEDVGLDDSLSDQIAYELKVQLSRSRGERNAIDDLRVF